MFFKKPHELKYRSISALFVTFSLFLFLSVFTVCVIMHNIDISLCLNVLRQSSGWLSRDLHLACGWMIPSIQLFLCGSVPKLLLKGPNIPLAPAQPSPAQQKCLDYADSTSLSQGSSVYYHRQSKLKNHPLGHQLMMTALSDQCENIFFVDRFGVNFSVFGLSQTQHISVKFQNISS